MIRVVERDSNRSCRWMRTSGLEGIPPELAAQTEATIKILNGRYGYVKYMILPDLAAYEACLRNNDEGDPR